MDSQPALPLPLRQMFKYLEIDIKRSFQIMPESMKNAVVACQSCEKFHVCDYDSESRYFRCPNRSLLDQLEELAA